MSIEVIRRQRYVYLTIYKSFYGKHEKNHVNIN
jgi:hypothetical protein